MPSPKISQAELAKRELAWRKWQKSAAEFFFEAWHIYIPGPTGGVKLPERRDAQHQAMDAFQEHRMVLCLKARQIGWTTLAACFAIWMVMFSDRPVQIIILSKTEREASKLKRRIKLGYDKLPVWAKERGPKKTHDTRLKMEFENGAAIEAMPSRNDPARGESADLIIVDEWAFLESPAEAWASIEPATNVGGRVIGFSTANGYGTWFHRFYTNAKLGVSGFVSLFYSWRAVPDRDEEWLEKTLASHDDRDLAAQEYAEDDVSCWLKSGSAFFDPESLTDPSNLPDPIARVNIMVRDDMSVFATEHPDGMVRMWVPRDPLHTYVIGADVAGGTTDGDYSVATVLDRSTGIQVAMWRGHVPPDEFGKHLAMLGWFYNNAYIGVERNNHGAATLSTLVNLKYKHLYYDRAVLSKQGSMPRERAPGWHTSAATKSLMLAELKSALREELVEVTSTETMEELWGYQAIVKKSKDGRERVSYGGMPHDDTVIALAIAWQMIKFATGKTINDPTPDDLWATPPQWETFEQAAGLVAAGTTTYITGGRR